jgi:GTPase SAR1 family protein
VHPSRAHYGKITLLADQTKFEVTEMHPDEYRFGEHYQERKKRVLELAQQYRAYADLDQETSAHAQSVRTQIALLQEGKYTVVIAGEVSSGKSTLINALLSDPILPTSVLQSTSAVVEIMKSEEKILRVIYGDGHVEEIRDNPETSDEDESAMKLRELGAIQDKHRRIPASLINSYLLRNETNPDLEALFQATGMPFNEERKKEASAYIEEYKSLDRIPVKIEFGFPLHFSFDEIRLVDTPGVNARGGLEDVTMEYLWNANAILFVRQISAIESQSFREFFERYTPNRKREALFLVLTHTGEKTEEERDNLLMEARRLYPEIAPGKIIAVDSLMRMMELKANLPERTPGEVRELLRGDRKMNQLLGSLFLFSEDDTDKFLQDVRRIHNFDNFASSIERFSEKAPYLQMGELLEAVTHGCEEKLKAVQEELDHLDNPSMSSQEAHAKITTMKKQIVEYRDKMGGFSESVLSQYTGQDGLLKQAGDDIKQSYLEKLEDCVDQTSVSKLVYDFNGDLSAKLSDAANEISAKYSAELESMSLRLQSDHSLHVPTVDLKAIELAALQEAHVEYRVKVTTGVKHGVFKAARRFFDWINVDSDSVLGERGKDKFEKQIVYDRNKHLASLIEFTGKEIKEAVSNIDPICDKMIQAYDNNFQSELKQLVDTRQAELSELERDLTDIQAREKGLERRKAVLEQFEGLKSSIEPILEDLT